MAVPRRLLGNTGLHVSALGFGASPFGGAFGAVSAAEAREAVHEAVHLGINFFDTSPFYGATKSESVLGEALQGIPRESVVLATKVGRYGDDAFDFSASRVIASVDESLARLQCGHIDLIQCHDIEFGSIEQIISETLPALHTLKRQGKVRFIGITGLPLKVLSAVLDRTPPGTVDVVLSYCHFTLNDTSLALTLPHWREKQVGVINASPLSMGLLTQTGPPPWHPAPPVLRSAAAAAASHCTAVGADLAKCALQFSLRNAQVDTTLVGMATVGQVRTNAAWAAEAFADEYADAVAPQLGAFFAPVKDLTWPSGRAENN